MKLDVNKALEMGTALPFALVRSLSQVTLGPVPASVDLEELIEARFFDEKEEIRIFRCEDGLQAVHLSAGAEGLIDTCSLMNTAFGSELTLCRELAFDEDGQACVSSVRLTGWKGGKK